MREEAIPRHRHEIGGIGDVQRAVVHLEQNAEVLRLILVARRLVAEGVVVDPDVVRVAQRDQVIERIP